MTRSVLGTCHHDCPDTCGWIATVEDQPTGAVAVKLRGNPDHPYSQGELCPKVNRFLDRVYANDRILRPLIRIGEKGTNEFREASWAEALELVRDRVTGVIAEHGGEAVATWWDAGNQGALQMSSLDRRFFAALGATRQTGSICGATARAGVAETYGTGRAGDPTHVRHAELILLWGTNTKLTNRHLWPFIEEARGNGAKVIVIDPIRTATAEAADEFVQPLPGTDVALMLAVMHVLVRDDLIDYDYVSRHATGFGELSARVAEWTPARAGEVCGLDPALIESLATAYGSTKKSFIRTLIGAEHHEHGAMFFRVLACLPVLTGAWTVLGGGMARSVGSWFDDTFDFDMFEPNPGGVARRGLQMNQVGQWLSDSSQGVHALFVWNGNPAVSAPNAAAVRRGLSRDDVFTVVSEQFMTDTARYADVIFPATTQLEHVDIVPAWGHLYLGWNEPAISPIGESVPNTVLWRRMAAAFDISDPLFDMDDHELLRRAFPKVDLEALREKGFLRIDVAEPLLPYVHGRFATLDGKALLRNEGLGLRGHDALPSYSAATIDSAYLLSLQTPKTHTRFLNSTYSHHHASMERGPYVEVDPKDAASRGVFEGDIVRVHNDRFSMDLPVKFSGRVRAGVVSVPWGWWGDKAVNQLTSDQLADWGGGVAYSSTRVELSAIDRQ